MRARIGLGIAGFVAVAALAAACGGDDGVAPARQDDSDASLGQEVAQETGTAGDPGGTAAETGSDPGSGTAETAIGQEIAGDGAAVIRLLGDSITVEGTGASAVGTTATVFAEGTYTITGTLNDGQVRVDAADQAKVTLILDGADITNSRGAAIYLVNADDVDIVLADGSQNRLADGAAYVFEVEGEDEPNAALFAKCDLDILGGGALSVVGRYNDGIASKDSLEIEGGTLTVTAADDGLRGRDDITVSGGSITVTSTGDGLTSDNEEDTTRGNIVIEDGMLDVTAGGDGLAAVGTVTVNGGTLVLKTGGGSTKTVASTASAKGIKGSAGITLSGGSFAIDAADDGIHSNQAIAISGGTYTIASADDGIHSDTTLVIDGGDIRVTKSYEGLESMVMTVNDGTIHVVSSDDGLNVAGGADGSGGFHPGGDTSQYWLYIHGGYVAVNATGDGIDSNGSIVMTGGTVLVNGPTSSANGALDIGDGGGAAFKISGGLLVAAGSSGMAIAPGTTSTQYSVLVNFASQAAGSLFHLQDAAGNDLVTFQPVRTFQSVAFSSPDLANGTFNAYLGGSHSGTATDSLFGDGAYTPGTLNATFTISGITTKVGQGGGPGGPGGM